MKIVFFLVYDDSAAPSKVNIVVSPTQRPLSFLVRSYLPVQKIPIQATSLSAWIGIFLRSELANILARKAWIGLIFCCQYFLRQLIFDGTTPWLR